MKIMLVGGGSGGHLTPLIAVADALKRQNPECKVIHVGQKQENLQEVVGHPAIDESFAISAGKFRRYHGEGLFRHLFDIKTILLNARDFFRFLRGAVQAYFLLGRQRPDVIFLKGGFVCVPVGFAARLRRIPYITHDSDAVPGLANRLTANHARYNTTALPAGQYPYDAKKTIQVGIPLQKEFKQINGAAKNEAKEALGYSAANKIVFVVGGGLGAQRVNRAVIAAATELLPQDKELRIIHLSGKKLFSETQSAYQQALQPEQLGQVKLIDFTTELYKYSAAGDVIISRAGATNIAEFAMQAKPCIIIPNPVLTGGQQIHNAAVLEKAGAAIILAEQQADEQLATMIRNLLNDNELQSKLGSKLHDFTLPDAADRIAVLLNQIAYNDPQVKS